MDETWTPQTIEVWQDWYWRDYRAFKGSFYSHWNLQHRGKTIFTSKTLQGVIEHAKAIEAQSDQTEGLDRNGESAVGEADLP